ncbi:MAG: hypothetical protein Q7T82_11860 [Armatimonadota bacterium]|nr:hypothetical protein [Armatimonadota bacterium]
MTAFSSPLGVCVLPEAGVNSARTVSYPHYVHEILKRSGVCCQAVDLQNLPEALHGLRLLLTVGEAELPEEVRTRLRRWVEDGGAWLSAAGTCGMPEVFGVEVEPAEYALGRTGGMAVLGEGYLEPTQRSHPVMSHIEIPLHYFNGLPVRATRGDVLAGTLDAHQRSTERAGVVESIFGKGRTLLICPDVTGAVVRIQQGVAVTRDGLSAPDGRSSICDGALKSDDGAVLDWIFDREPVPGAPGLKGFLQPVADQWRELLLRGVFHLAARAGVSLPVLWLYPRDLPALAHLSHDSDGNDPDCARRMLETLDAAGVKSTWCIIPPGYEPDTVEQIRGGGHELALHFDAHSDGTAWSEAEFDGQWNLIVKIFGGEKPVTNKNHFLRWEGDTEFFDWLERRGVQFDASKGASKTGEVGFNFGFCHPYFPVDPRGRLLDVLEISTLSQDLGHFAPVEVAEPILWAALKVHGVMHMVFHPAHIVKPGIEANLLALIEKARALGMEWWTGRQINAWERARRGVTWSDYRAASGNASVTLTAADSLDHASIMWLGGRSARVNVNGEERPSKLVKRWGFDFRSVTFDIERGREYRIETA